MHILFLSHYFPPEVNAPASRTYENAKRWVRAGHRVTVLTCAPNHPRGQVYPGHANRWWQWETMDGIRILRVKTYLSANKGVKKRILNYLSYLLSAVGFCVLVRRVDGVVSTSPQFFCGLAGYLVSKVKRRPWLLEIRDLWPESIIAVGALRQRRVIQFLEGVESFLYRRADHVIAVTQAFKDHISRRGVAAARISVITNGADLERFRPAGRRNGFRRQQRLEGKFIAAYIGTHGMAHGLDTVLNAACILQEREDLVFLLVGDGAERQHLLRRKAQMGLRNVIMLGQQPKARMPEILAAADACLVLLRDQVLFRTVIPSKIFEAMAMARPIVLGVRGESEAIVRKCNGGLCIPPEDATALAQAVCRLADEPQRARLCGHRGRNHVVARYDRDTLALRYLRRIQKTLRETAKARQGRTASRPAGDGWRPELNGDLRSEF